MRPIGNPWHRIFPVSGRPRRHGKQNPPNEVTLTQSIDKPLSEGRPPHLQADIQLVILRRTIVVPDINFPLLLETSPRFVKSKLLNANWQARSGTHYRGNFAHGTPPWVLD